MKPLINKKIISIWIISQNFKRFRDLSKGSEGDTGSENVIILTKTLLQSGQRI